jgi:hypothetical protein
MSSVTLRSPSRLTLALVTAITLTIAVVMPAYAVHDAGLFQLDRNAQTSVQSTPNAAEDWDLVCPAGTPQGAVACLGGSTAQAKAFTTDGIDATIFTGGGSKDDLNTTTWQWKNGSVPPKDDLAHAYSARYENGYLYFGADRTANNGDAQLGFWFFQGSVGPQQGGTFGPDTHQNGDILVLSDFSGGGSTVTIRVFQWRSPGGSINGTLDLIAGTAGSPADCVGPPPLGTGDQFCATVNTAVTPSPWSFTDKGGAPTGNFAPGEFYEGGIDLNALGLADECFSSFLAETRSSTSVDATLKDFVAGSFAVCKAAMSTTPSAGAGGTVAPGTIVTDTATVTGSLTTQTPTGSVTFYVCGPIATGLCETGTQVGTAKPLTGSGGTATATSDGVDTTNLAAGRYCFRATWPGDSNYPGALTHSGTGDSECFNVSKRSPTVTTQASAPIVLGSGSLTDVATLSGASANATGTITFRLYGPDDATCATSITSSTATVSGNGNYTSAAFTPTAAGTYRWIANYGGDANNNPTANGCNEANESVVVSPRSPTLTTQASAPMVLGSGSLTDVATLSGASANATGTITFNLYGPNDETCASSIDSSTATVSGNGSYTSAAYTPTAAGTYRWIANYSGDANNNATANGCNEANESVVVSPRSPALTTQASAPIIVGSGSLNDVATLSGATSNATGALTFDLYGPDDATCASSIFSSTATVSGNGSYTSLSFTPTIAGTYRWIANYGGDANNNPTANACNAANESVVVSPRSPALTTQASDPIVVGSGSLTDIATLSDATSDATGTITFNLYGPTDATCTTSIFSSTATVDGNGDYVSDSFTPTTAGTYRWIANYSCDVNNNPTANGCNEANESVVVSPRSPALTTQASPNIALGQGTLNDVATLSGATDNATGTITFNLYGPNDAMCTTSIFTSTVSVSGNGNYTSASFAPTAVGTFRWIANYGGDLNNNPTANACNAANESVQVTDTSSTSTAQNWLPNDSATITTGGGSTVSGSLSFTLYESNNCTGTVLRDTETFLLSSAASGVTRTTTNTTVRVLASTTVSWNVVFTSSDPFVAGSSHCETTSLTIVN